MNLRSATTPLVSLLFVAGLAALAGGCSSLLAAKPDAARYWVLGSNNATAGAVAGSEPLGTREVHIGLGPITLPEYLKDRRVLLRSGANQIEALPDDYWAEPLESGFPRALVYDVSQGLRTASALLYPWYSSKRVRWAVPIEVLQFETSSSGEGLLVARWRVVDEPDGAVVFASESRIVEAPAEPAAAASTEQRVAALRRGITRLAAEIVVQIEKLSRPAAASVPAATKPTTAVSQSAPEVSAPAPQPSAPAPQTSGVAR
ncbi:MAG: membrane integrity-associated transporter subunit PqiC [Deltaproteobacteria bacterium]|nr:membrane integrity-associated transporter subunit PqiC [Deltaproteobacteria bacterium]